MPMTRELLAGLDVGTTSVKALLLTADGDEVAVGRVPTRWDSTSHGVETSEKWIVDAARDALLKALRQAPGDRVIALGIASMAEAGVLVNRNDAALTPVIAWHDHRDEQQLDDLVAEIGGDTFSSRTGLPLWTQWSLTKHRWMRDNMPAAQQAVRRYNIAEWVARQFGANPVTELSLASRTGWLDLASRRPWSESMAWSGAPESLLNELVTAGTPIGRATGHDGLTQIAGATLTLAGHDHQAAVVGVGIGDSGDELDSCGTAEAFVRTIDPRLEPDSILDLTRSGVTVGWHAIRERWSLLGATQGGLILGRVQAALNIDREGLPALDAAALAAPDRPEVLTISNDADVEIDPNAEPGEVWRAATRAVTLQAEALGAVLDRASGQRRDLVVAGGWTNSTALMAAKVETFGALRTANTREPGARGAAFLAGMAHGTYASYDEMPHRVRRHSNPGEALTSADPSNQ